MCLLEHLSPQKHNLDAVNCTLDHCFNVFLHLLCHSLLNISDYCKNLLSTCFNKMLWPEFLLTRSGLHNLCRSWFYSGFGRVVTEKVTARDVGFIWMSLTLGSFTLGSVSS